ncbi:MAG: restriction endonuclease subunit S [Clostridium sp.]|nr:restriction endonuclease subunit S [Clostridium sp.]
MVKWGLISLEDACIPNGVVRGPFGGLLTKGIFVSSGYKVYEQRNAIYKSTKLGSYYITDQKYREMARFSVLPGDFIVSCSGTIGRIYRIPENAPEGVINQALLKLTIDEKKLNPSYFEKYFEWELFQNKIIDDTQGGAIKNLVGMDVFRKTLFACPSILEQTAIATALSDVDELIDSLESLIEKKKAIKQGAMQELLTGKKRLPRFSTAWNCTSLDNCFSQIVGGGTPSRSISAYWGGEIPWVTVKDFATFSPRQSQESITLDGLINSASHLIKANTLIIATRIAVGKIMKYEVDVAINQDLKALYVNDKFDSTFLFYWFQFNQNQIDSLGSGSTVKDIRLEQFRNIVISYPRKREQQAVAKILSDMDTEIEVLTQKLEKSRQIKQGMMQELLTGHIRLLQTATQKQKKAKAKKVPKAKAEQQGHNKHFHEAVILSTVVSLFSSEQFPLGRFRRQKFAYLLHRHAQESTQGFLKKAAGPYNPTIRYKDEKIALKAGYVTELGKGKFVQGEKSNEAVAYFVQWYGEDAIEWIKQFQYRKNDDLEVLTTVAEAIVDLKKSVLAITVESVKKVIRENPEWQPKLDKDCFSDFKIQYAIKESQKLFG